MITVHAVAHDDPRAAALQAAQQREIQEIYEDEELRPDMGDGSMLVTLLATDADGAAVGTVALRWSDYHPHLPGAAQVKRLYVAPEHRGHGHSRVLMGHAERAARTWGVTHVMADCGDRQAEAIGLYRATGYDVVDSFGAYAEDDDCLCFGKPLPTRVLVVNGTIGAGKTRIGAAVHDLLAEAGARTALIDGDALCQAEPTDPADPFNQELLFANLGAIAPHYRARGAGCVVIPRVVEDAADRDRYARAFASDGGPAEVAIVRVGASESTRRDRIVAREPEGYWQDWSLARTVELQDSLDALALDDAVIDNDGRDRLAVAADVMAAAGWVPPAVD